MDLINLSTELQVVLVAGYLGFWIATTGKDEKLRPTDIAMQILVYGFSAKIIILLLEKYEVEDQIIVYLTAIIASILSASLWRKYIRNITIGMFNVTGIHNSDHMPNLISTVISDTSIEWYYVQVHLKNGVIYESHFDALGDNVPINDILIDTDGNIGLYITKVYPVEGKPLAYEDDNSEMGPVITLLMAENIDQIDICWQKKHKKK